MLGRRAMVAVLGGLLAGLLVAACGSGPSARTLAREAVRTFEQAPVKTIQGSFTDGVIPVTVKLTVDSHGDASGTGTFDHFPVDFLRVGAKTYVKGVAYWQWERMRWWQTWPQLGQQWVRTYADPATSAFQVASTVAGTLTELKQQSTRLSSGSQVRVGSVWAYPLTYGSTTYDIGAVGHRLVAVRDQTAREGTNLLSRTRLSITYGGTLKVTAPGPGQFVDWNDPTTLPARYTDLGYVAKATCDGSGCTLTEKIGNDGGAPVGQSFLTVTYYDNQDDAGGPLASCHTAIPAIPHNGSAEVSCKATGAALVDWTSTYRYWWSTTITNPPYPT